MEMEKRTHFSIWYILAAIFFAFWIQSLLMARHEVSLTYSEFKKAVATRQIAQLSLGKEIIVGKLKVQGLERILSPDQMAQIRVARHGTYPFVTVRVEDPDLVKELQAAQIPFAGTLESTFLKNLLAWILPFVLLMAVWGFIFKRMGAAGGGLLSIGKSKAKIYVESDMKVTFADVAGIDEAVEELREVVSFLRTPERFTALGGRLPKGILLVGPPGTGKTLLAKAVAGEAKVPFFSLSGSEFVEMFVGVGAARVRDLFAQAQEKAPCIIFIDELDAIGRARGINPMGTNEEREQTLNQLLTEMDGFDPNKGVILMAATNRPEILDLALLRAGRFDRHVVVDRPDIRGREAILKVHAKGVVLAPEVDPAIVAARTPGLVGADLANIINEAALLAARAGKKAVEMADFDEAIDRVIAGPQKKSRVMTPREKHIVAHHEAGHALVAASVEHADPIHKISIIPRGVAVLGYTLQIPEEERHLLTQAELLDRLAVLLGGRVAEELVFGEISTGASDDLQKATQLARSIVREYGMSDSLGPAAFPPEKSLFLGSELMTSQPYSNETAKEIDAEIQRILKEVHERVTSILAARKEALLGVAARLEEKEVIDGEELLELIQRIESKTAHLVGT
ncbi:MAG TPA: ATP-dependent zinc metalloprotease FtsH [Sulfuriferula sp.]|nr:ATP-dependent zinc metalloprotease FtsH [Sulfuriferula sp.]